MSIIAEDGSGLTNSESYCTVAFANSYHAARGNTAWDALDDVDQKEPLLRKATDYMEAVYRQRWAGTRVTATQALSWPRFMVPMFDAPGAYAALPAYLPLNTVPTPVKAACAALALKALTIDLAPDLDRATKLEKVGPIEVEYMQGASEHVRYRAIDDMLYPFFGGVNAGGANIRLVRA